MASNVPDPRNPEEVMDSLSPEVREGPLGVPFVAPKGAPDLPGNSSHDDLSVDDLY